MIAALLLALPTSPLSPGPGVMLPAWARELGLKTNATTIERRAGLAPGTRANPPTVTLATLLPESPTCRLLTGRIGRPVPKTVRAAWAKEAHRPIGGIGYVRSATGRFQKTFVDCDERHRVVGMSDLYEDATAIIRGDFKRFQARLRGTLGDPTELIDDPEGRSLILMWRWSSGTTASLQEEENPKGSSLIVSLTR